MKKLKKISYEILFVLVFLLTFQLNAAETMPDAFFDGRPKIVNFYDGCLLLEDSFVLDHKRKFDEKYPNAEKVYMDEEAYTQNIQLALLAFIEAGKEEYHAPRRRGNFFTNGHNPDISYFEVFEEGFDIYVSYYKQSKVEQLNILKQGIDSVSKACKPVFDELVKCFKERFWPFHIKWQKAWYSLKEDNVIINWYGFVMHGRVSALFRCSGSGWACSSFLKNRTDIKEIDLFLLKGVSSIGNSFLEGCTEIEKLDLSPLCDVTSIGWYFLRNCEKLGVVNLTYLRKAHICPSGFLEGCPKLKECDTSFLALDHHYTLE